MENWPRTGRAHLFPQKIDLGDWPQIAPLFDQLEKRAAQAKSAAELEQWLLDWSELNAALDEEASRRYIAMTCHTDNADAEKAYLHFVEHVEPQLKPRQFALEKIYVAHPSELPREINLHSGKPPRYEVFDRDVKNHVELFRPENVALETEEAKLCAAISKTHRRADGEFSRRGKNARADGPLSRRAGPRAAAGGVGTGRQTPFAGRGQMRGDF